MSIEVLSSIEGDLLDTKFVEKTVEVFNGFDCLSCGNCCKNFSPIIESEEIQRITNALNISSIELFERYIEMDEDGDFVFKSQPCPMLNLADNRCRIYEFRPQACRSYPHTDVKPVKDYFDILEKNVTVCPAAKKIVEEVITSLDLSYE